MILQCKSCLKSFFYADDMDYKNCPNCDSTDFYTTAGSLAIKSDKQIIDERIMQTEIKETPNSDPLNAQSLEKKISQTGKKSGTKKS